MATSKQGVGRTLPPEGTDGQVPVVDTTAANDITWINAGAAAAFTPTTTGDWPGTDPVTIQQALDKLADRLNVLEP